MIEPKKDNTDLEDKFITKEELLNYLHTEFDFTIKDISLNGVQVEIPNKIYKICFSVDINKNVIDNAIKQKCQIIIVHHGLFWGNIKPIKTVLAERLKLLLENNIGLIAIHLPLDVHNTLGNNIIFFKKLKEYGIGFKIIDEFGYLKNYNEGISLCAEIKWDKKDRVSSDTFNERKDKNIDNTIFEDYVNYYEFISVLKNIFGENIHTFNYGNNIIKKIAFVSGSGGEFIEEAIEKGCDFFITGEIHHTDLYISKEGLLNLAVCGHYSTETLGIKALMNEIKRKFKIKTKYIDNKNVF